MELRDMKYFCTAAELGSVTKAAAALGVSQPFVTKIITQLEREIGTQLYDIESRHIVLNHFGEAFYKSARQILNQAEELMTMMDELQGRSENTITLLFNNSGYLEQLITEYRKAYPERSVSMTFAKREEIIDALNTNKADFALTLPPITGEESKMIESMNVFRDTGSVLLPPDSPLLEKEVLTMEDLKELSYIISPRGCGIRDVVDELFERYGLQPRVAYETNDFALQISMVKSGAGAVFCGVAHKDDPVIGPYCRNVQINRGFGNVGISYNKYRHMSPNMEDFKRFICGFFDDLKERYC
jgi:Transcriptional regulator